MSDATPGQPLLGATIGINQILWANDDLPDIAPPIDPLTILDEMARLGYRGSQLGMTFPRGEALRAALRSRDLRIAEVYACLPCGADGPTDEARDIGRAKTGRAPRGRGRRPRRGAAAHPRPGRPRGARRRPGRAVPERPRRPGACADLLAELAAEATRLGHPLAFHHHVGTYVETPAEVERLMAAADPALVGLCLDVGHYQLAGGDPVDAIERYGERVRHVHLKDVDPDVAAGCGPARSRTSSSGLRERVFTELGRGELDLPASSAALARRDYGAGSWSSRTRPGGRRPRAPRSRAPSSTSSCASCPACGRRREAPAMRIGLLGAGRIGRLHGR